MGLAKSNVVNFPSSGSNKSAVNPTPIRQKIDYRSIFLFARDDIICTLGERIVAELEQELSGKDGLELVVRHSGTQTRLEVRCINPLPSYLAWAYRIYQQELNRHFAEYSSRPLNFS